VFRGEQEKHIRDFELREEIDKLSMILRDKQRDHSMEISNLQLVHNDVVMRLEKEVSCLNRDKALLKSEIDRKQL
jgi:hypothetical protein